MKLTKKLAAAAMIVVASAGIIITNTGEEIPVDLKAYYKLDKIEQKAFQKAEIKAAKSGDEIKSLRSKTAKHFKGENGTMQAIVSSAPIHYFDNEDEVYKDYDLTEHAIDSTVKDNVLKKYDKYLRIGNDLVRWKDKKHDYRFVRDEGSYIEYKALFDTSGITIETLPNKTGVKQNYILYDETAVTELRWLIDTDANIVGETENTDIHFHDDEGVWQFMVSAPVAWDANETTVPVHSSVSGDTLIYVVDVNGAVYPVTVDPTTIITRTNAYGYIAMQGTDWATSRDVAAGNVAQSAQVISGWRSSSHFLQRGVVQFETSSVSGTVDSAKVVMVPTEALAQDFDIHIVEGTYDDDAIATDWYNDFTGWAASGAYGVNDLVTEISTSAFARGDSVRFKMTDPDNDINKAGRTKMVILSSDDIDDTDVNLGDNRVLWNSVAIYLEVWIAPPPINVPTNVVASNPTISTIDVLATPNHSASVDSFTVVNESDVWLARFLPTVLDSTTTVENLDPNTAYNIFAKVDSLAFGATSVSSDTIYTLAEAPTNLVLAEQDSVNFTITFDDGSNPAATTYAVRDSTRQVWFDAAGDTTSTQTWRTEAQWEAIDFTVEVDTSYLFGVVGKNGDDIETTYTFDSQSSNNRKEFTFVVGNSAWLNGDDAVYTIARGENLPVAINISSSFEIGQQLDTGVYYNYRAGFTIFIPDFDSLDTTKDIEIITTGQGDLSTTDFNIEAREGNWTLGTDMKNVYDNFDGHAADSTAYTGTNLIDTWGADADYAAGADANTMVLNAAGEAYVISIKGDSLQLALMSSRDISSTLPVGDELVGLSDIKFLLGYWQFDHVPSGVSLAGVSGEPDSMVVSWTDNSLTETSYAVVDSATGLIEYGTALADAETARIGGLTPNTYYAMKVKVVGGKIDGQYSDYDQAYTVSAAPVNSPVLVFYADGDSVSFAASACSTGTGNPLWTEYAVQDSFSGKYINFATAGTDTLATGVTWATIATIGDSVKLWLKNLISSKIALRAASRNGR